MLFCITHVLNKRKGGDQLINMMIYFITTAVLSGIDCLFTKQITFLNLGEIAGLFWLGVFIDAVAFVCWAIAIQNNDVSAVVNFSYLTPAVAMLFSVVILKEPVQVYSVIGLVIIFFGIILQEKGGSFHLFHIHR